MAFLKVVIFTALLAASNAAPGYDSSSFSHYGPVTATVHAPSLGYSHPPVVTAHAPVEIENHAPANYEFKYAVKDGHTHDIKEQAEKRVGDKVEGYYSLVEPDGTTRTVHYTSDDHNGFNAVVSKSGHAVHPATPVHAAAVSPSYSHAAHPITYPAAPSYSHVAPAVSYSNTLGHGYTAGGLGHGPSLERGYESYY